MAQFRGLASQWTETQWCSLVTPRCSLLAFRASNLGALVSTAQAGYGRTGKSTRAQKMTGLGDKS